MHSMKIALASIAFGVTVAPGLAIAQGGATTGAATGAIGGALIGGPIGAVIGGALGAAVGSAADANANTPPLGTAVVEQPPTTGTLIQRTCVHDAAGREMCHEVRR